MSALDLARKPLGSLTVDLCAQCQVVWFDTYESLQLTPGGTLGLFRAIHEAQAATPRPLAPPLPCPRCDTILALTQDLRQTTRFSYWRCRYGHGRLTPFFQFMREKSFIRPLTPPELARLAENVKTVRCASCGAPVAIAQASACAYCGSPVMVLDPDAVTKALAEIDQAARPPQASDADRRGDAIIAMARLEQEMARNRAAEETGGAIDLVGLGLSALGTLLRWR